MRTLEEHKKIIEQLKGKNVGFLNWLELQFDLQAFIAQAASAGDSETLAEASRIASKYSDLLGQQITRFRVEREIERHEANMRRSREMNEE